MWNFIAEHLIVVILGWLAFSLGLALAIGKAIGTNTKPSERIQREDDD